ncbi:MAG: Dam family site-specific DNA-(adenine-N6)-methyltransferase [Chloroflexi bacterium]|nr:Dam family site-specific DNA-(adenine-N6)-methyltransferase [Chloroflexota bacterium]
MNFTPLPRTDVKFVTVPPIKCQGIKTKLVPFILSNLRWDGRGRWVEPFLGSGVVLFNVQPECALVNDSNPHIINLYQRIFKDALTAEMVQTHLKHEGHRLLKEGEDHYYAVRERFNQTNDALDFLFLNRSCFNGLMRFNGQGKFNVPFCRKPDRFRPAYVTKIVNQIKAIRRIMQNKDWEFRVGDWRPCLSEIRRGDFVYLDPPYIGRHTDYYEQWSDEDAVELANQVQALPSGFALSMWKENKYRVNPHLVQHWRGITERTITHFYHVGATEDLRNSMEEVLLIKPDFAAPIKEKSKRVKPTQMSFALADGV